jgi:protease I
MGDNKILMVLAHTGFRDEELVVVKTVFEQSGWSVAIASNSPGEAIGKGGYKIKIDLTIDSVHSQDYCSIVVIGGPGVSTLINNHELPRVLKDFAYNRKIVAAICSAPVILANSGLLMGKKATVYPDKRHDLEMGGAYYTGKHVEKDDIFITANGPEAAGDFAKEILREIEHQSGVHKNANNLRSSFRRI